MRALTNVEHFIGVPSPLSRQNKIVYVNEESRHGFLGHTILLNLKELVYPLAQWTDRAIEWAKTEASFKTRPSAMR